MSAATRGPPSGERVAVELPPGRGWIRAVARILEAGDAFVPISLDLPESARRRARAEAGVDRVVSGDADSTSPDFPDLAALPPERPAMLLPTSGTTGAPKAVLHTAGSLAAQVRILHRAWDWSAADRILSALPLHHTHGIVNVVFSALAAGAQIEFLPRFDAAEAWERFAGGGITLFMGVPTMYTRLLRALSGAEPETRRRWAAGAERLRLFVSGSAALPEPVFLGFEEATGHRILERYGMTEFGMALGNPLHGERRPGFVGVPFPEVEVRLADGEIEVKSPGMFREYLGRPAETRAAFRDGWFRTGDVATIEDGSYRILGRRSVDFVNSGGERISALEVEHVLAAHPKVGECAVAGTPDPEWSEIVTAFVVPAGAEAPDLEELRAFARDRLAPFQLPRALRILPALPRNAMGKVLKSRLRDAGSQQ